MPSLRRRLLVGTGLGTAFALMAAGIALYALMRTSLQQDFDNTLREKAETLASMIEQSDERIELEFTEADMVEFERTLRPEYFQVWLADGTAVERSSSLDGQDLLSFDDCTNKASIHSIRLPDGRPGRIVTIAITTRLDDDTHPRLRPERLRFALARDILDVNATLEQLALVLVLIGVLTAVTTIGLLALLIHVGLKPVDQLARDISGIDEKLLAMRNDRATTPRELRPIVNQLNNLFGRLDAAFSREKTMTADVAHELRTPLAGIRSTLEVTLSRQRDSASYREAISTCLSITIQTQKLVENLLAIVRHDAQSEPIGKESTNIEAMLRDAWGAFEVTAREKGLHVGWQIETDLAIDTDHQMLSTVLSNLFENAVNYTDRSGSVMIEAGRRNGTLEICVANSGGQIKPEDVTRVFDRFWRGDIARRKDGAHCGLGLSLCKTIVERLGGSITARSLPEDEFSITVRL